MMHSIDAMPRNMVFGGVITVPETDHPPMRQRVSDCSGKPASDEGVRTCSGKRDGAAFEHRHAQTTYSFTHLTTRLTPSSFTTSR